ncbi:hypothetical protein HN385_00770 [archaeon]|jgi:hypothetical protein|nr:hypothetical protein [archaeon]MBT3450919.1 hypothetical protein [archaeon]MBT6869565.1 hypothetical protein [archaeon]MBT7193443.1 hypothetical protein [archaeon]MBT7381034.1 hypothetical protein [archaeon]
MDTKAKVGLAALVVGGASALFVAGHSYGDFLDSMPVVGNTIEVGDSEFTIKELDLPRDRNTLIKVGSELCGYDSSNSGYMKFEGFDTRVGPDYSVTATPKYTEDKCFQ